VSYFKKISPKNFLRKLKKQPDVYELKWEILTYYVLDQEFCSSKILAFCENYEPDVLVVDHKLLWWVLADRYLNVYLFFFVEDS
jgi:hypothetical protein